MTARQQLILAGFRRYGHDDPALAIFDALFDAASRFRGYRLPELYCGHDRRESEDGPINYPVACSPQAWASASLPYGLWNLLLETTIERLEVEHVEERGAPESFD